jgi:hypothetical protein
MQIRVKKWNKVLSSPAPGDKTDLFLIKYISIFRVFYDMDKDPE